MVNRLDGEACLRLLAAVVLNWWRDGQDLDGLAEFLDVPVDEVRGARPLRIDSWRRKRYVADGGQDGDGDVYF